MIPKYLKLNNFMSHKSSLIDFSKIKNATIILGMEDGSCKSSVAVGKTTLFNAIYYVLFDATVSKKSKVIREGSKKCEVEFIFKIYGEIYKIYRSRTNSTKNVYIFKKENEEWKNISAKTNSQTEEVICKVLKTSQKIFEKSSYFKQDDKNNLASTTPEKRKAMIIDMLNLKKWAVYEKQAKISKQDLEKEIDIIKRNITSIGNPNEAIKIYKENLQDIKNKIINNEDKIINLRNKLKANENKLNEFENNSPNDLKNKLKIENEKFIALSLEIKNISNVLNKKQSLLKEYDDSTIKNNKDLELYNKKYKTLEIVENISEEDYNDANNKLINNINLIKSKESFYKIFSKDVPEDEFCPTCLTELNDKNRNKIIKTKENKISVLSKEIEKLKKDNKKLNEIKNKYDLQNKKYNEYLFNKNEYSNKINNIKKSLEFFIEQKNNIESLINVLTTDLKNKENDYKASKDIIDNIKIEIKNNIYDDKIANLNEEIFNIKNELKYNENNIKEFYYKKGGIEKNIESANKAIEQLNKLKKELIIQEYDFSLYKEATNIFSSYGIPAMIVSTVLDSLQIEVNSVLNTIRPSIQIQFFLEKERSDGKQEDTLGMKFFVNSIEWDYELLSGGQKACIALALKFAISVINRKRCGSDIRLLMLDEIDQGLDAVGREAFYKAVQKWSKDMVILIITHNEQLIEMFDSKILVSKENGITSAEVLS